MAVDLDKLMFHTSYNTMKNLNVQKDYLDIPASVGAGVLYTDTVTFNLTEQIAFLQAYVFATDYGDYFSFLDGTYHDQWRTVNNNNDYLILSDAGLISYNIRMSLDVGSLTVSFVLSISRVGFGAINIRHNTFRVPITFVDYRLTN